MNEVSKLYALNTMEKLMTVKQSSGSEQNQKAQPMQAKTALNQRAIDQYHDHIHESLMAGNNPLPLDMWHIKHNQYTTGADAGPVSDTNRASDMGPDTALGALKAARAGALIDMRGETRRAEEYHRLANEAYRAASKIRDTIANYDCAIEMLGRAEVSKS